LDNLIHLNCPNKKTIAILSAIA